MTAYYLPEKEDLSTDRYWCFFFGKTVSGLISPDELETLDYQEKFYGGPELLNHLELAKTFITASPAIEQVIKVDKTRLGELLLEEREIKNIIDRKVKSWDTSNILKDWCVYVYVDSERDVIKERIKKNFSILKFIDQLKTVGIGETVALNIEQARSVLITDYLTFGRSGVTHCIWHSEKTPSLKYYPKNNRVNCFGCGKNCDTIDVVQQLNGCGFIEAVKFILKK